MCLEIQAHRYCYVASSLKILASGNEPGIHSYILLLRNDPYSGKFAQTAVRFLALSGESYRAVRVEVSYDFRDGIVNGYRIIKVFHGFAVIVKPAVPVCQTVFFVLALQFLVAAIMFDDCVCISRIIRYIVRTIFFGGCLIEFICAELNVCVVLYLII